MICRLSPRAHHVATGVLLLLLAQQLHAYQNYTEPACDAPQQPVIVTGSNKLAQHIPYSDYPFPPGELIDRISAGPRTPGGECRSGYTQVWSQPYKLGCFGSPSAGSCSWEMRCSPGGDRNYAYLDIAGGSFSHACQNPPAETLCSQLGGTSYSWDWDDVSTVGGDGVVRPMQDVCHQVNGNAACHVTLVNQFGTYFSSSGAAPESRFAIYAYSGDTCAEFEGGLASRAPAPPVSAENPGASLESNEDDQRLLTYRDASLESQVDMFGVASTTCFVDAVNVQWCYYGGDCQDYGPESCAAFSRQVGPQYTYDTTTGEVVQPDAYILVEEFGGFGAYLPGTWDQPNNSPPPNGNYDLPAPDGDGWTPGNGGTAGGGTTGGGGTVNLGTGTAAGCDSEPTCSEENTLCAILRQLHRNNCVGDGEFTGPDTSSYENQGEFEAAESELGGLHAEIDVGTGFALPSFSAPTECPAYGLGVVSLMGHQVDLSSIALVPMCQLADLLSYLIRAFSTLAALRIAMRGPA